MVVSHLDSDHSGGARSVLRGTRVAAVLSSIDPSHPALQGADRVLRCEAGQRFELGRLRVEVLRPSAADYERPRLATNAASCVVRIVLGRHRLLLTGDVPARGEAELAAREANLKVDWMSMPHHGSRSSSSEVLLDAAAPQWASAQAGYRNRFGHPDPEVLARYMARGVHIVRSDESGMAQWRFGSDGAVRLHRWRASMHRYWHNQPGLGAPEAGGRPEDESQADPGSLLAEPTSPD
jgi:competence protein ComEC